MRASIKWSDTIVNENFIVIQIMHFLSSETNRKSEWILMTCKHEVYSVDLKCMYVLYKLEIDCKDTKYEEITT